MFYFAFDLRFESSNGKVLLSANEINFISFVPFNLNEMFWKRHRRLKVVILLAYGSNTLLLPFKCVTFVSSNILLRFVLWHLIEISCGFFHSDCAFFLLSFASLFSMRAHTIHIQRLLNQSTTKQVASKTKPHKKLFCCYELEAHEAKTKIAFLNSQLDFICYTNRTRNTKI